MCLYSKTPKAIKAEKDIPVYKVIIQEIENGLLTPYMLEKIPNLPYTLKGKFKSSSLKNKFENNKEGYSEFLPHTIDNKLIPPFFIRTSPDMYEVGEGFIHAYEHLYDAQ